MKISSTLIKALQAAVSTKTFLTILALAWVARECNDRADRTNRKFLYSSGTLLRFGQTRPKNHTLGIWIQAAL